MLNKEAFLGNRTKIVHIDTLDGDVKIRQLSAMDNMRIASIAAQKAGVTIDDVQENPELMVHAFPTAISLAMVEPSFTADEVEAWRGDLTQALGALFAEIMEFSGLTDEVDSDPKEA